MLSFLILGIIPNAGQIPVFLFAPVGGAVADQHNRRLILVATQSVSIAYRPRSGSTLDSIREGFWYVGRTGPIRDLLILLGLISLLGIPYVVLMPIFADRILHGGAHGLGLLMGSSGVGALLAALILAARRGVPGLGRWVAVSSVAFGVSLILFSRSRSFWLSAALLIPVGFAMMTEMAASNTLIQAMTPDSLRGRVMAVYSMMFMGMAPVGALLSGTLAHHLGAPATVALGGAVCVLAGLGFGYRLPAFRRERRQMILDQQLPGDRRRQ